MTTSGKLCCVAQPSIVLCCLSHQHFDPEWIVKINVTSYKWRTLLHTWMYMCMYNIIHVLLSAYTNLPLAQTVKDWEHLWSSEPLKWPTHIPSITQPNERKYRCTCKAGTCTWLWHWVENEHFTILIQLAQYFTCLHFLNLSISPRVNPIQWTNTYTYICTYIHIYLYTTKE